MRGLFWHENRRVLPDDYEVYGFRWVKLNEDAKKGVGLLSAHVHQNGIRCIGSGACEYGCALTAGDPNASFWMFRLYEGSSFDFVAYTVPERRNG